MAESDRNPLQAKVIERSAIFSSCGLYRYVLWRRWGHGRYVMFIGLNPSTADETNDDPTIRRCVAFAKAWGYEALCMANLFAFRATDPAEMKKDIEPIGTYNDSTLISLAQDAGIIIAAWGVNGSYKRRDLSVRAILPPMSYLRLTKDGHPSHPLYLPANLRPIPWFDSSL